jgi:hypothetical protein
MSFNTQEQEILKWGVANGKSRQEVEQAITNYRTGVVPKPKAEATPSITDQIGTGLKQRGENILETSGRGDITLGEKVLRNAGDVVMGATDIVAPVIGAGLQASGLDKPLAAGVNAVANSSLGQATSEAYGNLSERTRENLQGLGAVASVIPVAKVAELGVTGAKSGIRTIRELRDAIDTATPEGLMRGKDYGQKAVDFISADPDKKVATILQRTAPEEVTSFAKLAERASIDGEAPTPFEITGEKLAGTTKILKARLDEIGKAKSAIIEPLREGLASFKIQTTPLIEGLTKLKNSFSDIDRGSSAVVQSIINDAKTIATKLDADRFIDKVQDALYTGNASQTLVQGSALDKQLRRLVGEYNTSLKNALPDEYAALNGQYANLIENLNIINRSLGEVVDGVPVRGASLIKQFFSPSGTKAKEIFEFIKKETNGEVDLAKDATLSKFTMELFDDPRARSLLQGIGDIPTTVTGVVTKVAEKLGGEKLRGKLRESTINKARETASPAKATKGGSPATTEVESKVSPSPDTTTSDKKVNSPPVDIERAPGLDSAERAVETKAIEKLQANPEKAVQEYNALPETHGGRIANTDEARKVFKDAGYIGSNARAVQEPSSFLNKIIYKRGLQNEGDAVLFAGGGGTGKTSAIKNLMPETLNKAAVILDGNLSSMKSAMARIKEANDAGKKAHIVYVYRDPIESLTEGMIARMKNNASEGGRLVPTSILVENHKGSYNVVKELVNKIMAGEMKNVAVDLVDNSLGRGKQSLMSLDKFFGIKYPADLQAKLIAETKKLYEQGKITKTQYEEIIK